MRVLKNTGAVAIFLFSLAFLAFRLAGGTTFAITGGSMEPTIHKGSLVLVEPASPAAVAVGEVVTFVLHGQTTTHRVIWIDQTPDGRSFTTKGDANAAADPEDKLFPAQIGIVRASIPLLGYALVYAGAYGWIALALAAAGVFAASFLQVLRGLRSGAAPGRSRA